MRTSPTANTRSPRQLLRRSPASVLTGHEPVNIGDYPVPLVDYIERLEDVALTLEALHQQVDGITATSIIRAMCCGRIISRGRDGVYRRCYYCRQPRICPCCYVLSKRGHARDFIGDLMRYGGRQVVFDLLFTMPDPTSPSDERRQVLVATESPKSLLRYRERWNDGLAYGEKKRMLRINLGLHLKPVRPGGMVKPHLHGILVTESEMRLRDIQPGLRDWWMHVVENEFGRPGKAIIKRLGDWRTQPKRKRRAHSRRPLSLLKLQNKLIYNSRLFKREWPADTVHRHRLLSELGIKRTNWQSRQLVHSDDRHTLPVEFDPVALEHDRMCVIGFGGGIPNSRPVDGYLRSKEQLQMQAAALLDAPCDFLDGLGDD